MALQVLLSTHLHLVHADVICVSLPFWLLCLMLQGLVNEPAISSFACCFQLMLILQLHAAVLVSRADVQSSVSPTAACMRAVLDGFSFMLACLGRSHGYYHVLQAITCVYTDNPVPEVRAVMEDHPTVLYMLKDLYHAQKLVTKELDPCNGHNGMMPYCVIPSEYADVHKGSKLQHDLEGPVL